jgi:4-aminobutyrate aminotransferase / (S)-3-amino-2-methylpropionate transaminase / 5-aminovalerate transaminase
MMGKFQRKYSLTPVKVPLVQTKYRRIVTAIPVPESIPIMEKLEKFEPASMQGQPPIVLDRSEGSSIYDRWGNQWLDWSSGVLISNVGNSHPAIRSALQEVLDKPLLSTYVFPHEARAELVEMLVSTAPDPTYKVFLLTTGSEATENCIKLSKTYGLEKYGPRKRYIVTFNNAFHGRTMGAQLAGGSDVQKRWLGKADDSFVQVPFPDGYKNEDTRFELFTETLAKAGIQAGEVCGVMSESYQGVGPDFLPVEYARRLAEWCSDNDVVLTMDEVQAGFGRTGKWFAFEHYGIKPDLIACGKGISSSLPLSAVIGREDIMSLYPPGSMTSTHSASPLPVAAAVANIRLLKAGGYILNAEMLEPIFKKGLLEIQKKNPRRAGCVQCRGLVAGIQMVKEGTKTPDAFAAIRINEKCFQKGVLMFAPVGIAGECIKIAPTLDTTEDALLEGIDVLDEAMDEVLG